MKNLWLLSILLFVGISALSQILPVEYDPYARFGHLTVSDGLPGNHITVIRQDGEGFMWIGTREGLARYDGTRFLTFQHHPQDSTSIPSNYINDILIIPDQTIYIGTREGIGIFRPETLDFQQVPIIFKDGRGLHDAHIRALLYEDAHHIWVETYNGILHLLNTQTFEAQTWSHDKPSQPYYDYHALFKDSRQTLWIGGRNLRPMKMENEVITPIETSAKDPKKKREADVAFYYEDRNKDFWTGGLDGLYQYARANDTVNKRMHTSSYDMAESSDGTLWIATGKGLARLNKLNGAITKYLASDNSPSSIIHNNINCVTIDRKGNIWAGTDQGISIFNISQNLIRHYQHLPHLEKSLSNNHVSCFMEDQRGNIWIGTRGGGLNKFLAHENQFENITRSNSDIRSDQIASLFQDNEGMIWTALWQGVGFNRLDPQKMTFKHYALDSATLKNDWYCGFETLGKDTLLAGFWGAEGIRLFDKKTESWLPHSFQPRDIPADAPLHQLATSDSLIWFYQRGNVVSSFCPATQNFQSYRTSDHIKQNQRFQIQSVELPSFSDIHQIISVDHLTLFLTNGGVAAFYAQNKRFRNLSETSHRLAAQCDNDEKTYLLGEKGLAVFKEKPGKIETVLPVEKLPVSPENINDLIWQSGTNLLMGTRSGVLKIDAESGKILTPAPNLEKINQTKRAVRQIEKGPDQTLTIVFNRGFALVETEQQPAFYNTENAFHLGLRDDRIRVAKACRERDLWWLGTEKGLYLFHPDKQKFEEIRAFQNISINDISCTEKHLYLVTNQGLAHMANSPRKVTFHNHYPDDMLSSHLITFIKKDSQGNIWAGTTGNGLNRIDPHNLKIKHFLPGKNFHGKEAQAFLETSKGTIYAGGDSLNVLDPEADSFRIASFSNRLPREKILALTEDHLGRILITTIHKIHIYEPETDRLFNLTPYIGADNITFTSASLKSSTNEIYQGSIKGFLKFNPSLLEPPSVIKQTRITGIEIMGEATNNQYVIKNGVDLDYNRNFLQFFFSDMVYPPDHDEYHYRLEGIDHDWIATQEASALYNRIPPGHYTFQVRSANPFGESLTASMPVTIHPPFWQTWWFISILVTLTGVSIWFWWHHRLNHLHILENNLQLKHQLLLSQMNPHFLFNALSAIQAYILQNNPREAAGYLSGFAKLMRLNLNNMALPVISITEETETLNHYLELQKLRHNNNFSYSVKLIPDTDHPELGIPTMMVQPFVENAAEHGMKDIQYVGRIDVVFKLKEKSWHVTVTDNGAGIENPCKQTNGFSHKSMGMKITRDRLRQLEKQYKQPCSLTITDRSNEPGPQSGTVVELKVPAIKLNNTQ